MNHFNGVKKQFQSSPGLQKQSSKNSKNIFLLCKGMIIPYWDPMVQKQAAYSERGSQFTRGNLHSNWNYGLIAVPNT